MSELMILRMPEVQKMTGLSKPGIYKLMKVDPPDGFPKPIKLGRRAVGWRRSEIEDWINSRPPAGEAA